VLVKNGLTFSNVDIFLRISGEKR